MAVSKKLQGEIDRCLKKVTEGVETFEDIWQKVHNANNSNQKEKYEADLKKEIKKLQRLRDQIKSWITSAEIKDKTALLEFRKLIETQMERFKVVERETKTKAYSKEGLGATQKLDPAQKERDEMREWLVCSIDALNIQVDQFESEIESLVAGKKKRLDKEKQDRMDELRVKLEKHRYHIRKLETILRMLHNMSVEVGKLKDIKDDVEYYIDSSEEPDFKENEFLYDDIIGEEELELSAAGLAGSADSGDTGATPTSTVSDVTPPLTLIPPSPSALPPSLNHSSDSRNQDPLPAKVVKPTAVRAVASNNGTAAGMGKPVSSSTPMKMMATPNNSSPSSGLNHAHAALAGNFAAVAAAPTPSVNATANIKPPVSHTVENGLSALINTHGSQVPLGGPLGSTGTALSSQPVDHAHMNNTNNSGTGSTSSCAANNVASSAASSSGADSSRASPMPSPSPPSHKPTLTHVTHNGPIPKLIDQMSSLKLMAQQVVEKSGQLEMAGQMVLDLEPVQGVETCDALIPPILGVAPLGSAPLTKEQHYQHSLLEAASYHLPHPADTERVRQYLPRNPVPTPQYYIQTNLAGSDTMEFHQRLSTESLFFMFYYMEGTKAQYISAKALKKQSWRFHTKYMMWFQRHEEPKVINEDYEQGTYIYFDYEKWSQKKKEGFTFEYKYLEDRELA